MKFRVERDSLADAVTWAARSLSARPTIPVLAGLLLSVTDDQLSVSGFDLEASTEVDLEVAAAAPGQALVSGRLLADITRALPPHPVDVTVDGSRLTISCGSARFTLPTMPVEDYPRLPSMPTTAGTVDSSEFATAVGQVAIAAGRDDTLPMLTGVRLEIEGDELRLAATDRYRLAVRELRWNPARSDLSASVLVPARALLETARALTSGAEVSIALALPGEGSAAGEGMIGFEGGGRRTTTRLLGGDFPRYQTLLPSQVNAVAELATPSFAEAVKRVALVAERNTAVRLSFSAGQLVLEAGTGDEAQAVEVLDAGYEGDDLQIAFNPTYLLDGLSAIESDTARMSFTEAGKPALITGKPAPDEQPDYRYLLMPIRLGA
jgi:DNA polymerase III subunit beta